MSIVVLKPKESHISYEKAAFAFAELYFKVTKKEIPVTETDDGVSDLVVIGSDSVNDFLTTEVLNLRLGSLGIRYGTDDYCIRSYCQNGRRVLILAGGRGRSTLYAVYDYFERFVGCHYFWDGDVTPHRDNIPMTDICINESPRFEYRGLRYFAHRGLKRFQAEHWSFEDWKQELDWMTKKRLNFFMLRIGMDDIWQRAFPDDLPYPDGFNTITGVDAEGYNDRTDFWTLEYRGKLRAKILDYASKLDLMHPVDCGTMTHWYSRTPTRFLENKKPDFCYQEDPRYVASDTGRVFDFTKKENMDYYMRLTKAMVEQQNDSSLFHTIGLGERRMYNDKNKNFALKLIAYRKISESIRLRYPNSKLLLASWDFAMTWTPNEVQNLIKELDPERTVILDYTSEIDDPDVSFLNWGVVNKFPWIFGLFHAYESESELKGPYDRSDARLKVAANDPYCKGMILWPELSHSDPLVLEYLANNSWSPLEKSVEEIAKDFCKNRYGAAAEHMNECWQKMLPFIKNSDWGGYSQRDKTDEKYYEYYSCWYGHQDIWTKPLDFLRKWQKDQVETQTHLSIKWQKTKPTVNEAVSALEILASNNNALLDKFVLRDAVDLTRTLLGRILNRLCVKAADSVEDKQSFETIQNNYFKGLELMAALLSVNPDFSVLSTLKDIEKTAPTNPNFEVVLKRNISNKYCSQPAYELVAYPFKDEAKAYFDLLTSGKKVDFSELRGSVYLKFEQTPLVNMQPVSIPEPCEIIFDIAKYLCEIKKTPCF